MAYNIPSSSLERELAERRKKTLSAGTERLLKLKIEKLNMTHLLTGTRADSGAGEGGVTQQVLNQRSRSSSTKMSFKKLIINEK